MKKIFVVLVVISLLFSSIKSENRTISDQYESLEVDAAELFYPQIDLPFTPSDSLIDPNKPVIYLTDRSNKRIYSINYETGVKTYIQLSLLPDRMCLVNNLLYVTLSIREHDGYWYLSEQSGAIAIVDTVLFKVNEQFNILIDPYDIKVSDNYIYISNGSGQEGLIDCYSKITKKRVGKYRSVTKSLITYNPSINTLYSSQYDSYNRDLNFNGKCGDPSTFPINNQVWGYEVEKASSEFKLSPDSKYIFNYSGFILECKESETQRMSLYDSINLEYNAIDFGGDDFFVSTSDSIVRFSYKDLSQISSVSFLHDAVNLFYLKQTDKLVIIYTIPETSVDKFYIKTINPPIKSHQVIMNKINGINALVMVNDYSYINDIRKLYDNLLSAEKPLVVNYDKLLTAENSLDAIFRNQSQTLMSIIDSFPEQVSSINTNSVIEASKIYDSLSPFYKKSIYNYSKLKTVIDLVVNKISFPTIAIPFIPTDSIMDYNNNKIYMSDSAKKRVYCANLITGEMSFIQFNETPKRFCLENNLLFVTFSESELYDSYNYFACSSIGIIESDIFVLKDKFNVFTNPYGIAVLNDYIFVSGLNYIQTYSMVTHEKISEIRNSFEGQILINKKFQRLSLIDYQSPKYNIQMFSINNGILTSCAPAENISANFIANNSHIELSNDESYIFKNDGSAYKFLENDRYNPQFVGKFEKNYTDLAIDDINKRIYTADNETIRKYDYPSLSFETQTKTPGKMINLFYNNKFQKIIGIYSAFSNTQTISYLSLIDPLKDVEILLMGNIDSLPENITLSHKQTILDLRASYESLSTEKRELVTNYEKLTIAESKLSKLINNSLFEFDESTGTIISYNGTATTLVIPAYINGEEVTTIGYAAFAGNTTLKSVSIPSTITNIEDMAFYMCTVLDNIIFPYNMSVIGSLAFAGCTSLININLPDSVVMTGYGILFGTSISKPVYIGNGEILIYVPLDTETIIVPDGVRRIEGMTFYYQTKLKTVTLPNSLLQIGYNAFGSCISLNNIVIPNTVTTIEDDAFLDCEEIQKLTLGINLTNIGSDIFKGCKKLKLFGEFDTAACNYAIENNIPFIIKVNENYDFDITNSEIVKYYGSESNVIIPSEFFGKTVKKLANFSFEYNSNILSITIPYPVEKIGVNVFYKCVNLSIVNLPNSLKKIGRGAFFYCDSLSNIDIPSSVTDIGSEAFAYTPFILKQTAEFACIGNGILIKYNGNSSNITIPNYVKIIAGMPFSNYSSVLSITMPDSVVGISDSAFACLNNLKSIKLSNSINIIGDGAFVSCTSLTNISIPTNIKTINVSVFSGCSSLMQINLPNGLLSIGAFAFTNCSALKSIVIPDSVTDIGDSAFEFCLNLSSITLPKNLKNLNSRLFFNDFLLKELVVPELVQSMHKDSILHTGINKITVLNKNMTFPLFNMFCADNKNTYYMEDDIFTLNVVICGFENSSAQEYCEFLSDYGYKFEVFSYYANFAFNSMGGSAVAGKSILKGNLAVAPVSPTRTGFVFAGWYTSSSYTTPWLFATSKVTANTTLYAKWLATPVAGLKVVSAGYNSLKLTWTATSGATNYEIYRATSATGTYSLVATTLASAGCAYTNTGLSFNTTYYYKVRAYSLYGTVKTYNTYSSVVSSKALPLAPASVVASSPSYNSIKLSWAAVTGANGYSVYRSTSATGTFTLLSTVTTAYYTNISLTPGATYYYKVAAYRLVGTTKVYGPQSAAVGKRVVPATITNLTAVRYSATSIKLAWGAISGASGYEIYHSTAVSGTYTLLKAQTLLTYTNTALKTGTTYYYKVRSYRLAGTTKVYSDFSAVKYAKP